MAERTGRECLSLPILQEPIDLQIRRETEVMKDFFKIQGLIYKHAVNGPDLQNLKEVGDDDTRVMLVQQGFHCTAGRKGLFN